MFWRRFGFLMMLGMLLSLSAQAQFSSTTNMQLKKPNSGLTSGWDVYLNGDWDQLDTYLGGINTLTSNSATPSVAGAINWKANNSSLTTITNFTGGFSGQQIVINCADSKTTIASDATIAVTSTFNCTGTNSITLILVGTVWTETSRTPVTLKPCDIAIGDQSGSAITNAQLGPQYRLCQIPVAATVVEIDVSSDAGTPNVIVGRNRCTTFTTGVCTAETRVNLTSSALAASTGGFTGCSRTAAVAGLDGGTTCAATLQNTVLAAGDYIELVSGTAGGTAKLMTIHITYAVN